MEFVEDKTRQIIRNVKVRVRCGVLLSACICGGGVGCVGKFVLENCLVARQVLEIEPSPPALFLPWLLFAAAAPPPPPLLTLNFDAIIARARAMLHCIHNAFRRCV